MKMLFSSPNAPEVALLKGLLDQAGITCELRNESIYPILPGAAFQPEVWVRKEDYTRACAVLNAWRQTTPGAQAQETAGTPNRPEAMLFFEGSRVWF